MRRILSSVAILLGVGCMVAAALLLWENQQDEQVAQQTSESVVTVFQSQMETQIAALSTTAIEVEEQATVEIEGEQYLGILSIPQLDLTLPVCSTWNEHKLMSTPCAYAGALENHNLIIAAHNYKSHFGTIHQLNLGDEITFLDATGTLHSYTLTAQETIDERELEQLATGEWDLTLFTCLYGDNTQRVVLRFSAIP